MLALSVPALMDCSAKDAADALGGCDEFQAGATLSGFGTAQVDAFIQGSADLAKIAGDLDLQVQTACVNIATDLGAAPDLSTKTGTDKTSAACDAATAAIKAIINAPANANASISVEFVPPRCEIDAMATANCEADCSADVNCKGGDVTVQCSPGELSGTCTAMCSGSCTATVQQPSITCEGSCSAECTGSCDASCTGSCDATCTGACDGTCSAMGADGKCAGTCTGTCKGTCSGMCKGSCAGSCKGSCTGSCQVKGGANVMCQGECKGGCSVAYTAPKCQGEVNPPMCNASADCKGSCNAHFQAHANCTPASVTVNASASAKTGDYAKLVTTLQTNMGVLIDAVVGKGKLAASVGGQVASSGAAVVQAAGSLTGHAIACVRAAAEASVSATASVNVSVMASASASGSVGGPSS